MQSALFGIPLANLGTTEAIERITTSEAIDRSIGVLDPVTRSSGILLLLPRFFPSVSRGLLVLLVTTLTDEHNVATRGDAFAHWSIILSCIRILYTRLLDE